jgi:polyhydroxybutyrate depolymerase
MKLQLLAGLAAVATAVTAVAVPTSASAASTGCTKAATGVGEAKEVSMTSGGSTRRYRVAIPAGYRKGVATPVILAFHGHNKNREYMENLTGFSDLPVIAVYPQGLKDEDDEAAWAGAWYPGTTDAKDDVRFVSDLLDELERDYCVDANRIFAAGKSNGGGFVNLLSCDLGARIAAFGAMAGAFYSGTRVCTGARPVPMIDLHGGADDKAPYDGEKPNDAVKRLPPIPEMLEEWRNRNGCTATPIDETPKARVHKLIYKNCKAALVHFKIERLGHDWASTSVNDDSDKPSVINATDEMWKFFQNHPLH